MEILYLFTVVSVFLLMIIFLGNLEKYLRIRQFKKDLKFYLTMKNKHVSLPSSYKRWKALYRYYRVYRFLMYIDSEEFLRSFHE